MAQGPILNSRIDGCAGSKALFLNRAVWAVMDSPINSVVLGFSIGRHEDVSDKCAAACRDQK
jgi:hypothetical protein